MLVLRVIMAREGLGQMIGPATSLEATKGNTDTTERDGLRKQLTSFAIVQKQPRILRDATAAHTLRNAEAGISEMRQRCCFLRK